MIVPARRPVPPRDSEDHVWFRANVQPHEPMLRAWLRSRFADQVELDDVVQEAFLRTLQSHASGAHMTSPKAFLFATARNLAIDQLRRRKVLQMEPLVENDGSNVLEDAEGIPAVVAHNQELELLTKAIQALPDRCRQIFTLRKVYGMSQGDIARKLQISENTVSAQLTIGVQRCMQFMAQARRERSDTWP